MNPQPTKNPNAVAPKLPHQGVINNPENFWTMVDKTETCWLWRSNCHPYGAMRINGKRWLAHRLSWVLNRGPIPDGLYVLHKCDNPRCVNPDHLFLGTNRDNMADMFQKGRNAKGNRHGSHLHPETRAYGMRNGAYTHPEKRVRLRGELNVHAKLTQAKAEEIRRKYANREANQYELAAQYGVRQGTIFKIIHRKAWL